MTYFVRYKKGVEKELSSLPKHAYVRITEKLLALADNPRPHGCIKLKGFAGKYRIRIGKYRALYSIDDDIVTVFVIKIAHRKKSYR